MSDPKKNKAETIVFNSPLDNPGLNNGAYGPYSGAIDTFLNEFQTGAFNTPEGQKSIDDIRHASTGMIGVLEPLTNAGMFGGPDAFPSTAEVVEQGKRIKIIEPDGTLTTYTDKYLNNPTVHEMLKREQDNKIKVEKFGRVLLVHMALFLGGKGKGDLSKYDDALGKDSPANPESQTRVVIDMTDGRVLAPMSAAAKSQLESLEKDAKDKAKSFDERAKAITKAEEELGNMENPEVPAAPREKNFFRRYFSFIFGHSAEYKAAIREAERVQGLRTSYQAKEQEIEALKNGDPSYSSLQKQKDDAQKALDESPAKKDMEFRRDLAQQYLDEKETHYQQELEKNTSSEYVRNSLRSKNAIDVMTNSKAAQFSMGSVGSMLNIIKNRAEINKLMKENPQSSPAVDAKIEQLRRKGYRVASGTVLDDTPYDDVNRFITQVDYQKASQYAFNAERKYGTDEIKKQQSFNNHARETYDDMVKGSKEDFKKVFGFEPTVDTLQGVINSVNLDSYIKTGIEKIDLDKYDPEQHKLPKVDEDNLGDMTLLLMSGIKTAVLGPNLEIARPSKVEPSKEVDSIAVYKPQM